MHSARHPIPAQRRPMNRLACEALEPRRLLSIDLLSDVDPSSGDALSDPSRLTQPVISGGLAYFVASDEQTGPELWRSDGTAAGTFRLKDINPGRYGSNPTNLTDVNGTLYFGAAGGTWKTDGTEAGTIPIRAYFPLESAVVIGRRIFALGYDDQHGTELWVTDDAGPRLVKDIDPQPYGNSYFNLTAVGDALFFTVYDGAHGTELWTSDGTESGTHLVADLTPGRDSSIIFSVTDFNRTAYFSVVRPGDVRELWKSDGTAAGTAKVGAAAPPTAELRVFGGRLLFVSGTALWQTDGTDAGTRLLRQFPSWNGGYGAPWLSEKEYKGALYFAAADGPEQGYELWRTDGTPQGTILVRDIDPRPYKSSGASFFTTVGENLFFLASGSDSTGTELWKTDGTADGTVLVKETIPGPAPLPSDRWQAPLRRLNDSTLLFVADDGVHGVELWRSNGTADGTSLVKDINREPHSSNPKWLTRVGDNVFFAATTQTAAIGDRAVATGLWKTDGTAGGTVQVSKIEPYVKPTPPYTLPMERTIMADVNGTLYFAGRDPSNTNPSAGTELWKSNGTAGGTVLVSDLHPTDSSYPKSLTNVNGRLFFVANTPDVGWELWTSNGAPFGTRLVKDIFPGPGAPAGTASVASPGVGHGGEVYAPALLTNVNGTLFFIANDGSGWDLWKSNGTDAGTVKVADLTLAYDTSVKNVCVVNNRLLFTIDAALWASDGTAAGTGPLTGPDGNVIRTWELVPFQDRMFFLGSDRDGAFDIWSTDGTRAGTSLAVDLRTAPPADGPGGLTAVGNSLFFNFHSRLVNHDYHSELWKSDGTPQGTTLVKPDVLPIRESAAAGGTLFFVSESGPTGSEIWQTDGTEAGTFMNRQIYLGYESFARDDGTYLAPPSDLISFEDAVLFTAEDMAHGRELWRAAPSSAPHAVLANYVFYNNSAYDGGDPAPGPADDQALSDRFYYRVEAVYPSQLSSIRRNYTTYTRGINGIMLDVSGLPAGTTLSPLDFLFRSGTGPDVSKWSGGPTPTSVTVRRGAGIGGSDRVTLIWPDHGTAPAGQSAVTNAWLQVTMRAGARTGLDQPYTFYYGNLVGDDTSWDSPATVDLSDWWTIRSELGRRSDPDSSSSSGDFNRNGRFDAGDLAAVRGNLGHRLSSFIAPDTDDVAAVRATPAPAASTEPPAPPPRRRTPYAPGATAMVRG